MTNHHPNCEHYNASLMDVWVVCLPGEKNGCVCDREADAKRMAHEDEDAPLDIVHKKMHRELFENLGEFNGF